MHAYRWVLYIRLLRLLSGLENMRAHKHIVSNTWLDLINKHKYTSQITIFNATASDSNACCALKNTKEQLGRRSRHFDKSQTWRIKLAYAHVYAWLMIWPNIFISNTHARVAHIHWCVRSVPLVSFLSEVVFGDFTFYDFDFSSALSTAVIYNIINAI
jgi:hypothetical protein